MKSSLSSRERMLAALACQQPDHTPCAFMAFKGLHLQSRSYLDFLKRQMALGLDTCVELPPRPPVVNNDHYNLHGLPVSYDPQVSSVEWKQTAEGGAATLLVKEYRTPAGTLRAEVQQTRDWRWGDHVPLFDDYVVPRSRKFLVESEPDLEALQYLLVLPKQEEITQYRQDSEPFIRFAREKGLLLAGGWGVGADLIGWICGLMNMIKLTHTQPAFIAGLLGLIAWWNRARMQVVLEPGLDLYIKRAWYENCDFWTPTTWKKFIQPILKEDAALAHQAGAKFGYILTSSAMPLIELIIESGVDVLIGVDPKEYDLQKTAALSREKLCLWGGLNGHLTVERGTREEVEREVETALDTLGGGGGFILSPVDNVREYPPEVAANVRTLIHTWQSRV